MLLSRWDPSWVRVRDGTCVSCIGRWSLPLSQQGSPKFTLIKSTAAAAKSLRLCPTPSDLMDCSLPRSSFHGILQTRVLEWGAIAFSAKKYTFVFFVTEYSESFNPYLVLIFFPPNTSPPKQVPVSSCSLCLPLPKSWHN